MQHRQTSAENLRDLIRNLGEEPKGKTVADLLDQIEKIAPGGGGTTVTEGNISEGDLDEIFKD
jgi:hypothetical protein